MKKLIKYPAAALLSAVMLGSIPELASADAGQIQICGFTKGGATATLSISPTLVTKPGCEGCADCTGCYSCGDPISLGGLVDQQSSIITVAKGAKVYICAWGAGYQYSDPSWFFIANEAGMYGLTATPAGLGYNYSGAWYDPKNYPDGSAKCTRTN